MPQKDEPNQPLRRRAPQQERSRQKIDLILEATTRLLQQMEPGAITTNAIAKLAGISIGTLYQYFPDKDAVYQALLARELKDLSARILEVMQGPPPAQPGGRISEVVRAVLDAYGGREIAHRRLMQYSIERGTTGLLGPLFERVMSSFAKDGVAGPGAPASLLSRTDAFVLVHAVTGVLRAAVAAPEATGAQRKALEASLTRLVFSFMASASSAPPHSERR